MHVADASANLNEARLARLVEGFADNSLSPLYVKEYPNRRGPGRYVLANSALAAMLGVSVGEILGRTDYDLMPEEIATAVTGNDLTVIGTATAHYFEEEVIWGGVPYSLLSQKVPLFDESHNLYAVGGMSFDVSTERTLEATVERNERLLRAMRALNADTYLVIAPDGTVVEADDPGSFGLGQHSIGQPLASLLPSDLAEELLATAQTLGDTDKAVQLVTASHVAELRSIDGGFVAVALHPPGRT